MARATHVLLRSLLIISCGVWAGCSDGRDRGGPGRDGGLDAGGGADAGVDGAPRGDGGGYDPFAPDASCGSAAIPTEQIPGSVLLLFDRSASMSRTPSGDEPSSGDPSKWELATGAINSVLGSVSDELSAGLLMFPTSSGEECDVTLGAGVPQVPVAPLSSSRTEIESTLSGATAGGGVTPIVDALRAGWDQLDTLDARGRRGVILVTDGAETCDNEDKEAVLERAATEHDENGYPTYVVGLTQANNFLSTMAVNGGTRRSDDCLAECTSPQCMSSSDCPGGADCFQPISSEPGLCGCTEDADCPPPLMCEDLPFVGKQCTGEANCCHYNATEDRFEMDFEETLSEIARRFVDSCVFDVPKDDPEMFDPEKVNVGVTFEGEERTVLPRSDDPSVNSWNYTDPSHESIVIQGPICDRLKMNPAEVEIVVGCRTILI